MLRIQLRALKPGLPGMGSHMLLTEADTTAATSPPAPLPAALASELLRGEEAYAQFEEAQKKQRPRHVFSTPTLYEALEAPADLSAATQPAGLAEGIQLKPYQLCAP